MWVKLPLPKEFILHGKVHRMGETRGFGRDGLDGPGTGTRDHHYSAPQQLCGKDIK